MLHGLTAYGFMLPVSVAVATACQLSGIGGAALFSPIFLLGFPLLGSNYPLDSAAHSIASALLTEVFGFASGLLGYSSRGLVCWPVVWQVAIVSVPTAFVGALSAATVASFPTLLRSVYAVLMLSLASKLLVQSPHTGASDDELHDLMDNDGAIISHDDEPGAHHDAHMDKDKDTVRRSGASTLRASSELKDGGGQVKPPHSRRRAREQMGDSTDVERVASAALKGARSGQSEPCTVCYHADATGRMHRFHKPARFTPSSLAAVAAGSLLTGVLGVGIGEVVLPELIRVRRMPLPLAAGTSVACVVVTAAAAALVQTGALVASADGELLQAVPWPLVCWTIPGVIIGGQLAPFIAGRGLITDNTIERFAAMLFAVVGLAFAARAIDGVAVLSSGELLIVLAALLLLVGAVVLHPA